MRYPAAAILMLATVLGVCGSPRLEWLQTIHDFGSFDESTGIVSCVFEGVNVGTDPLIVIDARANCGCTTPTYSREPMAPGDTLRINVGFNPIGRPGRFSKRITVQTNAEPPRSVLTIEGTVIGTSSTLRNRYPLADGHLQLRFGSFNYGDVNRGTVKNLYIEGYNMSRDTIVPQVSELPSYIDARIMPQRVPPGETFVLSTSFDSYRCSQWDLVTDTLTLSDGDARLRIPASAFVVEDFSGLSDEQLEQAPKMTGVPEVIDFDFLNPSRKRKFTITIENTGKTPLELRRVYTLEPSVSVRVNGPTTIRRGKKAKVELTVDPSLLTEQFLNGRLVIVTNDPRRPRMAVRLLGHLPLEPLP